MQKRNIGKDLLQAGERYRLLFRNDSGDMHQMCLLRHSFEVISLAGNPTAGVVKDVINPCGRMMPPVRWRRNMGRRPVDSAANDSSIPNPKGWMRSLGSCSFQPDRSS
jgi:hypothetical protein